MISKGAFGLRSGATPIEKSWPALTRTARYSLHLLLLTANLLVLTHASFGADTTRTVSTQRLAEFRKTYKITSLRVGTIARSTWIEGVLSGPVTEQSAAESTWSFLERNQDVLGIRDPRANLRIVGQKRDRIGVMDVHFQQLYRGMEVNTGQLSAHFTRDGRLQLVNGSYFPNIDLPTSPVVGKEKAQGVVAQAVASSDSLIVSKNDLIVFPWEGKYFLAWQIWASPGGEYFLDALTGDVIYHWGNVYDMPEDVGGGFREIPPPSPEPVKPLPESNWVPSPVPAGELPDSLRRGMESQPGSPPGEMHPVHGGAKSDSLHEGHGWLVLPPDLLPRPADTNSEKKPTPPKQQSAATRDPGANDVDQYDRNRGTVAHPCGCDLRSRTAEGRC